MSWHLLIKLYYLLDEVVFEKGNFLIKNKPKQIFLLANGLKVVTKIGSNLDNHSDWSSYYKSVWYKPGRGCVDFL